jgi:hypothetical protein
VKLMPRHEVIFLAAHNSGNVRVNLAARRDSISQHTIRDVKLSGYRRGYDVHSALSNIGPGVPGPVMNARALRAAKLKAVKYRIGRPAP